MQDQKLFCLSHPCTVRLFLSQEENTEWLTDVQDTARDFQITITGVRESCALQNCINRLEMIWKFVACSVCLHAAGSQKLLMSPGQWYPLGSRSLIPAQLPRVCGFVTAVLFTSEKGRHLKEMCLCAPFSIPFQDWLQKVLGVTSYDQVRGNDTCPSLWTLKDKPAPLKQRLGGTLLYVQAEGGSSVQWNPLARFENQKQSLMKD